MRVAFLSPLPPARSGIADYSEALIEALKPLVDLEIVSSAKQPYDASKVDVAIYQVGNNAHHEFVYEEALRHPGVVVMHESNLHHLITDLTIRRKDWDAYVAECEFNGGPAARDFALRVRALEVGPDYEGVRMTRRLLESARGVIVHSRYMRDEMRAAGYKGPVAVIPHGAWIPPVDRMAYRHKLGLDETIPLFGIFGFLKPYKRIAESLRAFRRLVRVSPAAKMILVGEAHPEFPVEAMIRSMGLESNVRVIGFTPIEDFVGYLAACDIVLNLRFPTVGESSGTLLRSLGLGKAVMVSEIGSFQEFPDDVCIKVPVGAGEEDLIFEYMNLLVSRPEAARALGARAKEYVATECNWKVVAKQYVAFVAAVAKGEEWNEDLVQAVSEATSEPAVDAEEVKPYLHTWAHNEQESWYLNTHETRLAKTLEITPAGAADQRILEMGAYLQITPALKTKLGYGDVRGCYFGEAGRTDTRSVVSTTGEPFTCEIDLFDAEKDRFPYEDAHFDTVICGELIEHLFEDPMHLMSEINRILKPGGHVVLTTPNIASYRGISAILQGFHPGLFHAYIKPNEQGEADPRHNREYTPREIHQLLENSGFEVTLLDTGDFRDEPHPEYGWVIHLLDRYMLDKSLRGEGIYAVGRKTGAVRERYPGWLYS
ncbi:MAG TPA: methyltransferase domain-containing protein [Bryobacteraceae bacterium]|nr:methyltransferase domain-containing protein [Bryobacteraceae bacterium]